MNAVELKGLTKAFGRVVANDSVDLVVRAGTIHAIVGENGAGKSTAMKLLFGMLRPDSGEIRVHGEKADFKSPIQAMKAGIGMVHQHFMLAGPYSVLENVLLGVEGVGPFSAISVSQAEERLRELGARYAMPVDPHARVEELAVGVQQRVEILKLLYRDSKVLILDEPTAVLTPQEIEALFTNLRRLRDEGRTILMITHKLKEVLALSDEVTVLRQGKTAGSTATSHATAESLAEWMVGRKVMLSVEPPRRPVPSVPAAPGHARLRVKDLLKGVSLEVHSGEIVGVAGVEGNGQSELLRALLFPAGRPVEILGQDVSSWSAAKIRGLKVGFLPEDRQRDGLVLDESAERNLLLGHQRNQRFVGPGGVIRQGALSAALQRAWEQFDLRPRQAGLAARNFSGGNQQKLVIAREFEHEPELLVAAHPTRGVDVGAIEWIHRRLIEARDKGAGVLLVSSELDEILSLSDRIVVLFDQKIVAEFSRGQADALTIGKAMANVGVA
ncbi:MAG: ABC transporter ATP-binding protein [Oligoflexia bacterium]|jgi:ABC-type uncharacterized transport system ATPase subunit